MRTPFFAWANYWVPRALMYLVNLFLGVLNLDAGNLFCGVFVSSVGLFGGFFCSVELYYRITGQFRSINENNSKS